MKYDTLVSVAVKNYPFEFIDILNNAAKESREAKDGYEPLLSEAACVIANLFLTNEDWHPKPDFTIERAFVDWKTEIEKSAEAIGKCEVISALAEEATELAQAALKLRRAMDGINPTPVSEDDALEKLHEEFADVLLCAKALGFNVSKVSSFIRDKAYRWATRLEERENE